MPTGTSSYSMKQSCSNHNRSTVSGGAKAFGPKCTWFSPYASVITGVLPCAWGSFASSPPLLITTPYLVAKLCLWQGFATYVGTSESTAALALLQHSCLHQVPRILLACWAQPRLLCHLLLTPRLGALPHLGLSLLTQSVAFWECRGYSELCFSAAVAHPGVLI